MDESRFLLAACETGDESASTELVERFRLRLLALVRERLSPSLVPRFDAEDVVQSTFRSFFTRARDGRFECERSGDLWRLLAAIAIHKLRRQVAVHTAEKRSIRREVAAGDLSGYAPVQREPPVSALAILADELNVLAETEEERRVLESRMAGETNAEIAAGVGCTTRTVRRIVERIRVRAERRWCERDSRSTVSAVPVFDGGREIDERELVLHEMIGAGGIGKVYRATWRPSPSSTTEIVTVKFLRKRFAVSRFVLERFAAEARALAELRHPGIVRIRGAGRSRGGQPFLVTDWHPGGDLDARRGCCTVDEAIAWTIAVAGAVAAAHARGIVHCDLKPANVLLGANGPVVVDFGHAVRPAVDSRSPGGTFAYMAPEFRRSPHGPVDERGDVYGLGAILHALLLGRPHSGTGRRPSTGNPLLDVVLDRCLADDPDSRYASAADVATALTAIGDSRPETRGAR